jgi:hypothetical protein
MSRFQLVVPLLLLGLGAACQPPPEDACNRVRFAWPFFQLDPSADVSDEVGIQISFDVRSDLAPNIRANLFLRDEESEEQAQTFVGEATSDADGLLSFADVSIPEGNILFILEAQDDCGLQRTGNRAFVWDGLGIPQCSLTLGLPPEIPEDGSLPILGAEHDEDPGEDGIQVRVTVDAGRPDMEVRIFARDRELDEDQEFTLDSAADGTAEALLTLGVGEQAIRSVCYWAPEDLRSTSPTYVFDVESP